MDSELEFKMKLSKQLTALMKAKGKRQADICRDTEIPTSLMSNYVKGKIIPSLENAVAIADSLEVSLDELVGRNPKVELNEEEKEFISKLRELNDEDCSHIIHYLDFAYSKKISQKPSSNKVG